MRKKVSVGKRFAAAACLGGAVFWLWTARAERQAHYTPEYDREDLRPLLLKEELAEEEYELLFLQTGLGRSGVEELYREGRQAELFYLQERFFMPVEYECRQVNPVCRGERLIKPSEADVAAACRQRLAAYSDGEVRIPSASSGRTARVEGLGEATVFRSSPASPGDARQADGQAGSQEDAAAALCWPEGGEAAFDFLPVARTGDILVTFSGHVFGWRSGHAGIVVDGEAGLTLEAVSIGSVSQICSVESWREYPCFALLRLKGCTEEEAADIAAYAASNLADVPYDLFRLTDAAERGVRAEEALSGTQCAHLVWEAFARFGYDLDGDGGRIVTPSDLYESGLLEVIQLYGISPLRND